MATKFTLPELGENIQNADIVDVFVSVGDRIEKDQPVLEIETDKATLEVPSTVAGVVKALHVEAGGRASVGDPIMTVEEEAEAEAPPAEAGPPEPSPAAEEASEEEPARKAEPKDTGGNGKAAPTAWKPRARTSVEETRRVAPAGPAVRRVARELGLDVHQIPGSGPGGRIGIDDVKSHARRVMKSRKEAPVGPMGAAAAPPLPDFSKWGPVRKEAVSNIRRATAEAMARAWALAPRVTQHDKADVTDLERLRKQYSARVEQAGGKLTMTAILLKVCAAALKAFPKFNASLDLAQEEIVYKDYYHLGVAVDTERGLLVPVIRDVDRKNIMAISVEIGEVAEKARTRKLKPEDMQGATFTISNLGGIGGTSFSPIVNWPEVAILGVSRGRMEPVWQEGEFVPRLMLPLSLSYDHRLIDGADAARFVRWVAESLEQPFQLLLEG